MTRGATKRIEKKPRAAAKKKPKAGTTKKPKAAAKKKPKGARKKQPKAAAKKKPRAATRKKPKIVPKKNPRTAAKRTSRTRPDDVVDTSKPVKDVVGCQVIGRTRSVDGHVEICLEGHEWHRLCKLGDTQVDRDQRYVCTESGLKPVTSARSRTRSKIVLQSPPNPKSGSRSRTTNYRSISVSPSPTPVRNRYNPLRYILGARIKKSR